MRFRSLFASITLVLGLVAPGRAVDIMITINGTITSADAGMGYAVNDPVSFFWVVNDFAPQTPVGAISSNSYYYWTQENQGSEPKLWANVGGTGIGGTYNEAPGSAPWERLQVSDSDHDVLEIYMKTDSFDTTTNNHGIYLNADSSYLIKELQFNGKNDSTIPGASFVSPLPNPATFLGGYLGTSSILSQLSAYIAASNGTTELRANFTATSVTFAQVPEPSTYILGGLATGVMAFVSRRRKAKGKG